MILELILVIASLISLVLSIFNTPGGNIGLVLSGSLLSMTYLFGGFFVFNRLSIKKAFNKTYTQGISALRVIFSILTGIAFSIFCIGIIFIFMRWPGAKMELGIGITLVTIALIVAVIKMLITKAVFYKRMTIRTIIALLIGIMALIIPQEFFIDIKYKNHPAYRDALKYSIQHPDDENAQKRAWEESKKMHGGMNNDTIKPHNNE